MIKTEEEKINKLDVYHKLQEEGFEPLELNLSSEKEIVYGDPNQRFIDLIVQDKSIAFKNIKTNKGKFLLFDDNEIKDNSYLDAFVKTVRKLI